jgi:Relaxase/Mobilisation nuclease domain
MIHSIHKGAGFGGVLRYISNPDKGYLLGGSYPPDTSTREMAADLGRLGHERSSKPVFHASLSLPPGECLDDAQWLRAASHYLNGLGYSDVPFVVYRHTDRAHDHIHIVASRVSYGGKLVSDSNDRDRGMGLCREIEKLYELAPPTPRNTPSLRQEELHGVKNKGEEHLKSTLRSVIQQSAEGRPTLSTFIERLEQQGVGVRLNRTSQGSIRGISFEIEGSTFAGSSLGREFSWASLQKNHGIVQDVQAVPRPPSPAPSPWSAEALEKLQSLLKESPSRAGLRAAEALRSEGAAALGDIANASTLAHQTVPSVRFPAHEAAPFPTAQRAAIFTGTVGDPRAALALVDALAGSPDPAQAVAARLLVRHYATAAAEGSPAPDVFVERLRGAGITFDTSRPEPRLLIGPHSVALDSLRGTLDAASFDSRHPDPGPPLPGSPGDRRDLAELLEHLRVAARSGHQAPGRDDAAALRADLPAGGPGPGDRPSGPDPAARHTQDLAPGDGGLPRGLSGHGHRADLPASAMGAHAGADTPAPAWPEHRAALSGDAGLPALAAAGAPGPQQPALAQLEAIGDSRFDLRLQRPEGTQTLRGLDVGEVGEIAATLERLPAPAPGLFVRPAQGSPVQFVGVVSAEAVQAAARRGFEPAILQAMPSGALAAWVRHAPVSPEQLPLLQRAARLAYGLSPEAPLRTFGPLATGSDLLHVSTRPYSRATHFAESLAATRRATDKLVDAQLRAHRVPPLPPPSPARGRRRADRAATERAWLQNALARRVSPRVVFQVLAHDGARAHASAVLTARKALSILAASTPKAQLATVARSLSLPTSYAQAIVKAVRIVRHFL